MPMYKRVILKLSGEALSPVAEGCGQGCYDPERVMDTARMIAELTKLGVEPGVVLGGGNIWRGRFTRAMNPVNADQIGMLATIMNALCLADALERVGVKCDVFTAQEMNRFARLYTARDADATLCAGGVALLAGGTGHPFFTTDTGAALRAAELRADAVFKGTTVEGVYDKDPRVHADAKLIGDISYAECIARGLHVMDIAAFQLCMERGVGAIRIFSMDDLDNVIRVAQGERLGSTVHA
ncbi:uridine monophosphate kinase [Bacillota bacterium Meth-B3]